MSGLVERLRQSFDANDERDLVRGEMMLDEAADEIERVRSIGRDIVDIINTDPRILCEGGDWRAALSKIEDLAIGIYAQICAETDPKEIDGGAK